MRIAQLAPLAESVPPRLYGGTERVIAWLVDELVELGHDVTLFASGDSRTKAKLYPVWPRALRLGRMGVDPNAACAMLVEAIAEHAAGFDLIHSHVDWLPLPVLSRTDVPYLTTMHGRLDLPGLPDVIGAFPKAPFVSISDNQRRPLLEANWIDTIQHGLPKDLFRPSYEPGSYLAFLGRLTVDKGPEDAMRIARAAGMPLRIAAKIPRAETAYFKKKLEPNIDGEKIELVGKADEARKQPFLAGAARPAVSDRLARAVRPRHDRGDGLRDARHRLPLRLGAGSGGGRRHRLRRRERRGGDRGCERSRPSRQKSRPRPVRGSASSRAGWRGSAKAGTS
ncbi:glycosyltransferase involved in cell wall biosynthesis [Bradyrhizobium japonicum]